MKFVKDSGLCVSKMSDFSVDNSNELHFAHCKQHHAQEQPSMAPTLNIRLAIGSSIIADWQFNDPEVQFGCSEEEVEVTEGIKIPKIGTLGDDLLVVSLEKRFCSTEGVLNSLAE